MPQVEISGTVTIGPANGGSGSFPSSSNTMQLDTTPSPKQSGAATGVLIRTLSSPSSYVTLDGIGPTSTVTKCDFLSFRSDGAVKLRLTQADPAGGADIVSIINVQGLEVHEFPTNGYLKTLEAQGSARIEYAASGLQ